MLWQNIKTMYDNNGCFLVILLSLSNVDQVSDGIYVYRFQRIQLLIFMYVSAPLHTCIILNNSKWQINWLFTLWKPKILETKKKRTDVFDFLKKRGHIYFLQDKHFTDENMRQIYVDFGFEVYFNNGTSSSRGVAIFIEKI